MGDAAVMSDAVSWIRLQTALGAGAAINEVIEYFGSAENLFAAGETEWRMSPVLVPRQTERLCQSSRQQAEEVLGCGLGTKYLMENKPLRDAIVNNGALITEFQPFTQASKYTFPIRNRIISGISLGVLVVEASIKSGSLITANYALEQGRDVFALPCSILDPAFAGTNKLIDDGATVATKPLDLLYPYAEEYGIRIDEVKSVGKIMRETANKNANVYGKARDISFDNPQTGRKRREARQKAASELSGNTKAVYCVLQEEYQSADEISRRAEIGIGETLTALTALEIAGLATGAGGKRYRLA